MRNAGEKCMYGVKMTGIKAVETEESEALWCEKKGALLFIVGFACFIQTFMMSTENNNIEEINRRIACG